MNWRRIVGALILTVLSSLVLSLGAGMVYLFMKYTPLGWQWVPPIGVTGIGLFVFFYRTWD
jgi:hypothetical protein